MLPWYYHNTTLVDGKIIYCKILQDSYKLGKFCKILTKNSILARFLSVMAFLQDSCKKLCSITRVLQEMHLFALKIIWFAGNNEKGFRIFDLLIRFWRLELFVPCQLCWSNTVLDLIPSWKSFLKNVEFFPLRLVSWDSTLLKIFWQNSEYFLFKVRKQLLTVWKKIPQVCIWTRRMLFWQPGQKRLTKNAEKWNFFQKK